MRYVVIDDVEDPNLPRHLKTAEAITVRDAPLSPELIGQAGRLRIISRHGVGLDNIPLDFCTARSIVVTTVGDANTRSVAEHTLYLLLAVARRGPLMDASVRHGEFSKRNEIIGQELAGRTVLIVGYGRIGRAFASMVGALGMTVLVYDPYSSQVADMPSRVSSLEQGLKAADIVSLHLPLTSDTMGIIGSRELALMRQGSILLNVARGGLVNEYALAASLAEGHLFGAGIDTFDTEPPSPSSPLISQRNVVLSPHVAALTAGALTKMGVLTVQNAIDGINGNLSPEYVANPAVLDN